MNNGKYANKVGRKSIIAVLLMSIFFVVAFSPMADNGDSDGASTTGTSSWKCTITLSGSSVTTKYWVDDVQQSVSPVGLMMSEGSWGFDKNSGYGPFNSFYAAFDMNGNIICHLNPYNLKKSVDGLTTVNGTKISDCNIMWCIPKFYISGSSTLTLGSDSSIGNVHPAFVINYTTYNYLAYGVYEATTTTSGSKTLLSSVSGATPVSGTLEDLRMYAHNYSLSNNVKVSLVWNYYQWMAYRMCSFAVMQSLDSQATVGYGACGSGLFSPASYPTTGIYDQYPYAGCAGSVSKSAGAKLFIENAWGSKNEYLDDTYWADGFLRAGQNSNPTLSIYNGMSVISGVKSIYQFGYAPYSTDPASWGLPLGGSTTYDSSAASKSIDSIYTYQEYNDLPMGKVSVGGSRNEAAYAGISYLTALNNDKDGGRLVFLFNDETVKFLTISLEDNGKLTITPYGGTSTTATTTTRFYISTYRIVDDTITLSNGTTVKAEGKTGYGFQKWSKDGATLGTGTYDVSSENDTIAVSFIPQGKLLITPGTNGKIANETKGTETTSTATYCIDSYTVSGSTITLSNGEVLRAMGNSANYAFEKWTKGGSKLNDGTYTLSTSEEHSITASYVYRDLFTLTATIDSEHGRFDTGLYQYSKTYNVSPNTKVTITNASISFTDLNGDAVKLTVVKFKNNEIPAGWSNGNVSKEKGGEYFIIEGNTTLTALFDKTYKITIKGDSDKDGMIVPSQPSLGHNDTSADVSHMFYVRNGTEPSADGNVLTFKYLADEWRSEEETITVTAEGDSYVFSAWSSGYSDPITSQKTITASFDRVRVSFYYDYGAQSTTSTIVTMDSGQKLELVGNAAYVDGKVVATATPADGFAFGS